MQTLDLVRVSKNTISTVPKTECVLDGPNCRTWYTHRYRIPLPCKLNGIYNRGDSFPFEPNGIPSCSKSKEKLSLIGCLDLGTLIWDIIDI